MATNIKGGMAAFANANRTADRVQTWREMNPDAVALWAVRGCKQFRISLPAPVESYTDVLYEGDSESDARRCVWEHLSTRPESPERLIIFRMGVVATIVDVC